MLVVAVWRLMVLTGWSWSQDDWVYLRDAVNTPFWPYVTQDYKGHLMPLQFAINWVLREVAPLNFGYAIAIIVALSLASLFVWMLVYERIFGPRAANLIPFALLALSPLLSVSATWWAAATQTLGLQLSAGLVALATVAWAQRPSRSTLVGLGSAYVLGLLVWQKALLLTILVPFLVVMVTQGELRERLRMARRPSVVVALISVIYLPLYLYVTSRNVGTGTQFSTRSVSEVVGFFFSGTIDTAIPALLGGPWHWPGTPSEFTVSTGALPLLLVMVFIAVVGLALRIWRESWIPFLLGVTYAFASWGLVLFSSRYDAFGASAARDFRYGADVFVVLLLAMTLMLMTPQGQRRELRPTAGWAATAYSSTARRRLTVSAVILVAISTAVGNGRMWEGLQQRSPKEWVDNVLADARAHPEAKLSNEQVPDRVMQALYFPSDAQVSTILDAAGLPMAFDEPSENQVIVGPEGRFHHFEVDPVSTNAGPDPTPDCGYAVAPGRAATIPLTRELYNWRWGVELDYFSGGAGVLRVRGSTTSASIPYQEGLHSITWATVDEVTDLMVQVEPGSEPLCITSVKVGNPKPGELLE